MCTNQQVTSTADTFSLYLESGGSSDCLQVLGKNTQFIYELKYINLLGNQLEICSYFRSAHSTDCNCKVVKFLIV